MLIFRLCPYFIGGSPWGAIMTTPGKIPKNISRKKIKIIFKNIFFSLSSHAISLAGLHASALWPAHPSDLLQLISSDHSQLIASDPLQLLSSGTMPAHSSLCWMWAASPALQTIPGKVSADRMRCRIFLAQPQLLISQDLQLHLCRSFRQRLSRSDALRCLSALWPVPS